MRDTISARYLNYIYIVYSPDFPRVRGVRLPRDGGWKIIESDSHCYRTVVEVEWRNVSNEDGGPICILWNLKGLLYD